MELNLKKQAELAQRILEDGTQYQSNKETIKTLFEEEVTNDEDYKKLVKKRLTVIDSFYSTNMGKRLYGIDDLANALVDYSDNQLKDLSQEFLKDPSKDGDVKSLIFENKYGIHKSGKKGGKATSLVSKYLYFLSGCDFPIYDGFAENSYKNLRKRGLFNVMPTISEDNYFECMTKLNKDTGIKNYGKLDNLLWLMGKLLKGSFSLIMNPKKYKNLTKRVGGYEILKQIKSAKIDSFIRDRVIEKKIYEDSDLFTKDQKKFFEFVFDLKDK